jgi:cobalt-zinc-cadmium efflux system protein
MGPGHGHGHGHGPPRGHDHGHDHGRDHGHVQRHAQGEASHAGHGVDAGRGASPSRQLAIALALTGTFFFVEMAAGFWTGSLSLLSDAGHMLGDSGALALALIAQRIARRPRTRVHTFGFRRVELLAALVNGVLLLLTCLMIVHEAVARLGTPQPIQAGPMLVVAATGLLVNLASAWVLGHGESNANVRAALLHVISDALGSLASLVAALCVLYLNLALADTLVSLGIALLIAVSAFRLLRDTSSVLMERAPSHVDLSELERLVRTTHGVADVHDLHAWAISDGFDAVTVHVVLDGAAHGTDVAQAVGARIRDRFGITHVTVQPEAPPASAQLVPVQRLIERKRGRDD